MIFRFNDVEIYYETVGTGKPILMIHGGGPDHRLMKGGMEPVFETESHYKRIYFDLPGMGISTTSDWINSSDDMLNVILEFINFVIPEGTFLLAGESYGGYLSRGVISKLSSRIEGLLLLCPVIKPPNNRVLPDKTVLLKNPDLLSSIAKDDRDKYESIAVVQDKESWLLYKNNVIPGLNIANYDLLRRIASNGYPFSFEVDSINARFEKPVLVITGRQDANVGYKDAWGVMDNYPRGSYIVLDRAGHCLEIEQRMVFKCLTIEWLSRCDEFATQF
ncbi:MAG: alpha/beta hydrolase [Clostridiales bacterium]|nr:alpha/beta hydrolase [Clostridiales bacterium]